MSESCPAERGTRLEGHVGHLWPCHPPGTLEGCRWRVGQSPSGLQKGDATAHVVIIQASDEILHQWVVCYLLEMSRQLVEMQQ